MTSSSRQKRPISFIGMNVNQVMLELTSQLNDMEENLENGSTSQVSRNALVKQTDMIRKELQKLNKYQEEEELPQKVRSKLEDLANEFQYLKRSKSSTSSSPTGSSPVLPPPPTNSTPTKQRTKAINGNRRNPDIEFAAELGQGLLIEVRKLNNMIQEKDETIKKLQLSLADKERTHETTQRHLKQKDEVAERLKEQNWNLEVSNQELNAHLLESNQSIVKHNSEYSRLAKQLKSQTEQIEIMKAQEEKSTSIIEAMKARHEQETYHLRRHAATAQRENAQIQKEVEALNTELKICKAKLAIKLASTRVDDSTPNDTMVESTLDQGSDSEQSNQIAPINTVSASLSTRSQALETETLKQSLAHAHRIISNLRTSSHKEKLEKFELKKMLSDSQENIEQLRKEMASWNTNNSLSLASSGGRSKGRKKNVTTKKRRGGVARQPRGLCPSESDSEPFSPTNEEGKEDEENDSLNEDEEDEESTDENMHFNGTTLDEMFSFDNSPFSSTVMKPLSSELEAKAQVIDAGINTDPVDFRQCMHGNVTIQQKPEVINHLEQEQDSTSSDPFVPPKDKSIQANNNQEENNSRLLLDNVVPTSIVNVNQTTTDITSSTSSTTNNVFIQEQISKALIKERQEIAVRAESILSPEQIQAILLPPPSITHSISLSTGEQAITPINRSIPVQTIKTSSPQCTSDTEKQTQSVHAHNIISETEDMVPQSRVNNLIQVAIAEKTVDMLPKDEVESFITASNAEIRANVESKLREILIPNTKTVGETQIPIEPLGGIISNEDADVLVQQVIHVEKEKVQQQVDLVLVDALKRQKGHLKSLAEKLEASRMADLDRLGAETDSLTVKQIELEMVEDMTHKDRVEKQRSEFEEAYQAKQAEIETLLNKIDLHKKEAEEMNQRMTTMFTKESADVLVKRAVAEALEGTEKSQAGMISREYANNMVKDEVSKALELERKEAAQREEIEAMSMISKAEAEALAKVAASEAIVKERQAMAAREKELMTKEEATALSRSAVREAIDKERNEISALLARERKVLREKEEQMITKEEAQRNTVEAVRVALLEHHKTNKELTTITLSDLASSSTSLPSSSTEGLVENNRNVNPTRLSQLQNEKSVSGKNELTPPSTIERSVSTSRLALPSVIVPPSPSTSTPASTSRKLRLSSSVSSLSLRFGSGRKENSIQKSQRPSIDSTASNSFGTLRVLESTSYYGGSNRLLSNHQNSSVSISTLSSIGDHNGPIPNPLSSDENVSKNNTDMYAISSITQTMIGEWMFKHTRRHVGSGISENKHQRFFWVHPYTTMLYWSSVEPGAEGSETSTKSLYIESVSEVPSHDNTGASPKSMLIRTPKRNIKITATSLERHELWMKSLSYLLGRSNNGGSHLSEEPKLTTDSAVEQCNASISSNVSDNSIHQHADITQYDSEDSGELVNIRQCCNGKHDVSTL